MSIRQDIRKRVITELNAAPPSGVPEATERRYVSGENVRGATTRLAVFPMDETPERVGGPGGALTKRSVVMVVQCIVYVEKPDEADDALDAMLDHVVAVLGDTNLNKLATDIVEVGTQWVVDTSSGVTVALALSRWRMNYQTVKNDMSRKQ